MSPASSAGNDLRVDSPAEAAMLQKALREGKIKPENVKRAEMALQAFAGEQSFAKAQRENAGRLGPGASSLVRGPLEGVTGMVTGPVDLAAGIARELGAPIPKPNFEKKVQKDIDSITTRPRSSGGKALESAEALATGAALGPRMPRFSRVRPEVRNFLRENPRVTLTPGMRRGGLMNTLEQQFGKALPFIKGRRAAAVQQWNVEDLNRILRGANRPEIPTNIRTTRAALRYTHQQLSQGYDQLLSNMALDVDKGTVPLRSRLTQIKQAYAGLDKAQQDALNYVIDDVILRAPTPQAAGQVAAAQARAGLTPTRPPVASIKEIDRVLKQESKRATARNTHQDDRLIEAFRDIRSTVDQVGRDQNGQLWNEKEQLDKSWAEWATDVRAGKGKQGGVFSPASKRQALTGKDPTRDARSTTEGTHPGIARVDQAEDILRGAEPDSGTTGGVVTAKVAKDMATHIGAGLAGGAAAAGHIPAALGLGAGYLSPGAIYNDPVLRVLQERALAGAPKLISGPGALFGASQSLQPGEAEDNPALKQFGVAQ